MFYSNVKKFFDSPCSPVGFLKSLSKKDINAEEYEVGLLRHSRNRRSFMRSSYAGLNALQHYKYQYKSEPSLPFSESVITAATLPEILMASLQHHAVHISASDPHPRGISDQPQLSPREGKRKRLQREASSPTTKQRKQSNGKQSMIIEAPTRVMSDSDHTARSETSSLHSADSTEQQNIEPDEAGLTHIRHIINELITTEKSYMQDLQDILTGYMQPMEQCTELFHPDTVKDIFINIKTIGDFHLDFLTKLDEYEKDLDKLANCFLSKESEDGFSLYNEYCRKVPRALDLVHSSLNDENLKPFMVECQLSLNHYFPLTEFLHRPIQRVLKYPLLLRDLLKYTSGTKYGPVVAAALDKITGVAVRINKVKRVQELDSNEIMGWTGEALLEYGVLKLEDSFKIHGSKDSRYLFLFEKLLLITKPHKDGRFQYKAHLLPTEILMTENINGEKEPTKFEISNFTQKKIKFIVQASDVSKKCTWVREIKRCVLEHQPDISMQMREVLLNEIPCIDSSNQLDDILTSSRYKSLIPLGGLTEHTPDVDDQALYPLAFSPPHKTPSPIYQTPSPQIPYDDSGIEDPAPKNQVDYSSLDVKAIKDRWIMKEKMAGSNTAPMRVHHKRNSDVKSETWHNYHKHEADGSYKSDVSNQNSHGYPRTSSPKKLLSPTNGSERSNSIDKPCLARISHLNNPTDNTSNVYRDIKSLVEADAANAQATYNNTSDIALSPESNSDWESSNLFSGLNQNSGNEILSPKHCNEVPGFKPPQNLNSKSNSNQNDLNSKTFNDDHDLVDKFYKGCNISGTGTNKRNSFILEKDPMVGKKMPSPPSSESDVTPSSTADCVSRIKKLYAKHELTIKKDGQTVDRDDQSESETDLIELYDKEVIRLKTEMSKMETETDGSVKSRSASPPKSGYRSPLKTLEDKTLSRDTCVYQGSSLIRGSQPPTEAVNQNISRWITPQVESESSTDESYPEPGSMPHRGKSSASGLHKPSGRTASTEQSSGAKKSALKKRRTPTDPKTTPTNPRTRSNPTKPERTDSRESMGSRGSGASRAGSKQEIGLGRGRSKKDLMKTRSSSFSQEDNPFSRECKNKDRPASRPHGTTPSSTTTKISAGVPKSTVKKSTAASNFSKPATSNISKPAASNFSKPSSAANISKPATSNVSKPAASNFSKPSSAANISKPSSVPVRSREPKVYSRSLTSAYLQAATKTAPPTRFGLVKTVSEPDLQELNSVRSSNLVTKMKTQLLTNTTTESK